MSNIISVEKAVKISKKLKKENRQIVLAGGVFDILHPGHIKFLEAAKKKGNVLFVLLESDENVKKYKGGDRPINSQSDRALILSSLKPVDYVVILNEMKSDKDYDDLIVRLKPNVIATTKKSPQEIHSRRQVKLIGAKLALVINRLSDKSTTRLANIIKKENNL